MSHFVVFVDLGPDAYGAQYGDIEARLAEIMDPYDENKNVPPYREELGENEVEHALEWAGGEAREPGQKKYSLPEEFLRNWPLHQPDNDRYVKAAYEAYAGSEIERDSEGVWFRWSTYNPDSKWDWYQIGGRWAGNFQLREGVGVERRELVTAHGQIAKQFLRPGDEIPLPAQMVVSDGTWGIRGNDGLMASRTSETGVDVARKGDIDIEQVRAQNKKRAGEAWDRWQADAREQLAQDWFEKEWAEFQAGTLDERRQKYLEGRGVKTKMDLSLARSAWMYGFTNQPLTTTREEAIAQAGEEFPLIPYAIIDREGTWHGRGDMGWWGMSANEKDDWPQQVETWWNLIPDDTVIAAIDCHI